MHNVEDCDDIHILLDQHSSVGNYSIVLAHTETIVCGYTCRHSGELSGFRANQSSLLLLNVVCREAANTNIKVFALIQPELEPTIFCSRWTRYIALPMPSSVSCSVFCRLLFVL